MPVNQVQISAWISAETRMLLEAATEARGLKKGYVIEEAVLHFLHALRELPSDIIVPPRLCLTEASSRDVVETLLRPPPPTEALRALMAGEAGDDVP